MADSLVNGHERPRLDGSASCPSYYSLGMRRKEAGLAARLPVQIYCNRLGFASGPGKPIEVTPDTPNAMVPSIVYEGKLYRTTGKQIPAEVDDSAIVGRISSVVPLSQLPSNEGEANFGEVGDPYARTSDGLLVIMGHEWVLFEKSIK